MFIFSDSPKEQKYLNVISNLVTPEEADGASDQGSLHFLFGVNLPLDQQDTAEGQESIKAKVNAIRSKLVQQVRTHQEQVKIQPIHIVYFKILTHFWTLTHCGTMTHQNSDKLWNVYIL